MGKGGNAALDYFYVNGKQEVGGGWRFDMVKIRAASVACCHTHVKKRI
jgi:hypothetical protein